MLRHLWLEGQRSSAMLPLLRQCTFLFRRRVILLYAAGTLPYLYVPLEGRRPGGWRKGTIRRAATYGGGTAATLL